MCLLHSICTDMPCLCAHKLIWVVSNELRTIVLARTVTLHLFLNDPSVYLNASYIPTKANYLILINLNSIYLKLNLAQERGGKHTEKFAMAKLLRACVRQTMWAHIQFEFLFVLLSFVRLKYGLIARTFPTIDINVILFAKCFTFNYVVHSFKYYTLVRYETILFLCLYIIFKWAISLYHVWHF